MKNLHIILGLLFIITLSNLQAQKFADIDNFVLSIKLDKNSSKKDIAQAVTKTATTDEEKARAIFIWVANNIAYDTDFNANTFNISSTNNASSALKYRKTVCQGYSELYASLCRHIGLKVSTITGHAKWFNYQPNGKLETHAWNLVELDSGKYIMVDATWGAGSVNGKKFEKQLNTSWFDADPSLFVFTHLPYNDKYQLLNPSVSMELFERLPGIPPVLSSMGIDGTALLDYFSSNSKAWFPLVYSGSLNSGLVVQKMPFVGKLEKGVTYEFGFSAADNSKIALINNNEFTYIESSKLVKYIPKDAGKLNIAVSKNGSNYFDVIFSYEVK